MKTSYESTYERILRLKDRHQAAMESFKWWLRWLMPVTAAAVVAMLIPCFGTAAKTVAYAELLPSQIILAAAMFRCIRRESAYGRAFRSALDEVPNWLQYRAIKFYGDEEWAMAAIECNEAHIPGDCPLCGAQ
jgi:hypothetical protein